MSITVNNGTAQNTITTRPGVDAEVSASGNELTIERQGDGSVRRDVFDLSTTDGQQAMSQAFLDMGIAVPEFVGGSASDYIASLSSEAQAALGSIATEVSGSLNMVNNTQAAGTSLQSRWAEFVAKQADTGNVDVNALVQQVLKDAYLENTKDLYHYASKVKFYNEGKKSIRDELKRARETLAEHAGADGTAAVSFTGKSFAVDTVTLDASGMPQVQVADGDPAATGTKEQLDTYIRNLEEKLNSVGDDAQLANVDLQNMLQKQQQTLQMMSNISKMLHDTAMAVIRKIG